LRVTGLTESPQALLKEISHSESRTFYQDERSFGKKKYQREVEREPMSSRTREQLLPQIETIRNDSDVANGSRIENAPDRRARVPNEIEKNEGNDQTAKSVANCPRIASFEPGFGERRSNQKEESREDDDGSAEKDLC